MLFNFLNQFLQLCSRIFHLRRKATDVLIMFHQDYTDYAV